MPDLEFDLNYKINLKDAMYGVIAEFFSRSNLRPSEMSFYIYEIDEIKNDLDNSFSSNELLLELTSKKYDFVVVFNTKVQYLVGGIYPIKLPSNTYPNKTALAVNAIAAIIKALRTWRKDQIENDQKDKSRVRVFYFEED